MNILLLTNNGDNFELRRTSCRDHMYSATRAAVKKSLEKGTLFIRQHRKKISVGYNRFTTVSTELKNGKLRLGCHIFDQKSTKQILRWAGIQ